MATIVQPYNPWREQLALTALGNVAGNIIGDIWARHKQSEENKKINAFRGQLQQDLGNIAGGNISLAPQNAPEGYNSDPWASAFHKNNTPLTQFDIGTGGIGKVPSIQDIAQNIDRLAATPRFSMLGQEAVGKVRNDFMQRAYADMFANGNNLGDKMDIITQSVMNGSTPVQALAPYGQYATQRLQPYVFSNINTGDKVGVLASNAETGQSAPAFLTAMGIDPNEAARNAASVQVANINANASARKAQIDANFQQQNLEFTRFQQAVILNSDALKRIDDSITSHLQVMDTLQTEQEKALYRQKFIAPLEAEKSRLIFETEQLRQNHIAGLGLQALGTQGASQTTQTAGNGKSNSVWFSLVGNPQGIQISNNGHYGAFRKNHPDTPHQGIDISAPNINGKDVTLDTRMGDTFYVQEAGNIRGYGNAVYIRTQRNGRTIEYRFGHLQDGSIPFKKGQTIKAGDIIGKVGNTGISSGPHLHFEVRVGDADGKNMKAVDPSSFFESFPMDNPAPQTPSQDATAPAQAQTSDTPYLVSPDGTKMSRREFEEIRDKGHYSADFLFEALSNKGWKLDNSPNLSALGNHQNNTNPPDNKPATPSQKTPVTPQVSALGSPPFPDNRRDKNRNNHPAQTAGNPHAGVNPAWGWADFLNRFRNNENTLGRNFQALGSDPRNPPGYSFSGNPWQGLIPTSQGFPSDVTPVQALGVTSLNNPLLQGFKLTPIPDSTYGNDVISPQVALNDPFYYFKLLYGNNWR